MAGLIRFTARIARRKYVGVCDLDLSTKELSRKYLPFFQHQHDQVHAFVSLLFVFHGLPVFTRSRTRQNFQLVHIIGPVQNFGPPARNFGPLRAEFAWREWQKTLGGHVANWAGLSGFSPRENKISHTFFIDCINKYSKVSNAYNSNDCHGVFNGGMLNKGWSFSRSRFDCLGLMHFFHG